jgi:hypothetical protein
VVRAVPGGRRRTQKNSNRRECLAQPIAEDIAKRMKARLTAIESVNVTPQGRQQIYGGPATPLEELPSEYLSSSIDEVPVRVRLDVRYHYSLQGAGG